MLTWWLNKHTLYSFYHCSNSFYDLTQRSINSAIELSVRRCTIQRRTEIAEFMPTYIQHVSGFRTIYEEFDLHNQENMKIWHQKQSTPALWNRDECTMTLAKYCFVNIEYGTIFQQHKCLAAIIHYSWLLGYLQSLLIVNKNEDLLVAIE